MNDAISGLTDYIYNQLQTGQTADEINTQLLAAGWTPEQVQQGFYAVQARVMPTGMPPVAPGAPAATGPQANGVKRGRIKTGWILFKVSLNVLRGNPYLIRYFLMTWVWIIALNLAMGILVYLLFVHVLADQYAAGQEPSELLWYVISFFSYLITYCIINFYAAALAANILDIFKGQRQPYKVYIQAARSKFVTIFVYSLIASIVGTLIQFIAERIRFAGWLLRFILDTAWALGTLFVLPIIMTSDVGAPTAIKQSFRFFRQTWGENVTAKVTVNAPLFLINMAISVVFWISFIAIISTGIWPLAIALLIVYLVVIISIAVVGSFANNLINVALFYYANYHQVPAAFSAEMLDNILIKGKPRRLFGRKAAQS
ncbi:MAG: hypothetical protein JWM37_488 [Candidatus Saccharibacteria bacterium]|nr:hypothetical protein [Candidatus Saccharibacteria bacterium]